MIADAATGAALALPLTAQAQRGFEQGVQAGLQARCWCWKGAVDVIGWFLDGI